MKSTAFFAVALSTVALGLAPLLDASIAQSTLLVPQLTTDRASFNRSVIAQRSRVQRIQFASGAYSSTVQDGVERGTRNIYLVGASKGQTLTVKITSEENNAVFDVAAPSGKIGQRRLLLREAAEWTTVLPASGDYQIIVGSTRGNSSYRLQVAIR
jgi:hypothetical protein